MAAKNSQSSGSPSPLILSVLLALAALLVGTAIATHGSLPYRLEGPRASTKPFKTFQEFYPFYRQEHGNTRNVQLHVIGTTLVILIMVTMQPTAMLSAMIACATGVYLFISATLLYTGCLLCEVFATVPHGFYEFGSILVVFIACNRLLSGSYGIIPLVVGYSFAWVGHFFFEHNKPATFIYPSYSLMGDFYQLFQVATGDLKVF